MNFFNSLIDENAEWNDKGIAVITPIVLFVIWIVGELSI